MKGLPRSLARASDISIPVKKLVIPIHGEFDVAAVGAAIGFGTDLLGVLPEGYLHLLSAAFILKATRDSGNVAAATFNLKVAFGTVATANADLTDAGNQDIVPATDLGAAVGGVSPTKVQNNVPAEIASIIDNTAADKEVHMNMSIPAADITNDGTASIGLSGAVQLNYIRLFDD